MVFMFGEVCSSDFYLYLFHFIHLYFLLESWEKAKTMTECYDYLFEIAVKMKSIGIDPALKPESEPDYC
jgi:hypothetical protein